MGGRESYSGKAYSPSESDYTIPLLNQEANPSFLYKPSLFSVRISLF
jgi:hypothetical protein